MELRAKIEREQDLVNYVLNIEKEYLSAQTRKKATDLVRKRCITLVNRVNKELGLKIDKKTGVASLESISSRYYVDILKSYRSLIKQTGIKHHALKTNLAKLIKKHGDEFDTTMLDYSLSIDIIRDNVKRLVVEHKGTYLGNDLEALKIEHQSYYVLIPNQYIDKKNKESNTENLEKSLNDQLTINSKLMIERIHNMLNSNDEQSLISGLAIATGRRLSEITYRADFKAAGANEVLFTGQLKMKSRHLFEQIKPIEIPTLVESKLVIKALKKLRKMQSGQIIKYQRINAKGDVEQVEIAHEKAIKDQVFDADTIEQLKVMYSEKMNIFIRKLFPSSTFKITRSIYASIAYKIAAYKAESYEAFKKRVFNHSEINTQLHYSKVLIDDNIDTLSISPTKEKPKKEDIDKAFLAELKEYDHAISLKKRSPAMTTIHEWFKTQVKDGYINRSTPKLATKINTGMGKGNYNYNTIKSYLTIVGLPIK